MADSSQPLDSCDFSAEKLTMIFAFRDTFCNLLIKFLGDIFPGMIISARQTNVVDIVDATTRKRRNVSIENNEALSLETRFVDQVARLCLSPASLYIFIHLSEMFRQRCCILQTGQEKDIATIASLRVPLSSSQSSI